MPSKPTEEFVSLDEEHIIHTIWPLKERPRDVVFRRGRGIFLEDTEGRKYIDGSSQLVNVNLGHSRREIMEAAMEQMKELPFTHTFSGFSNTAVISCSQKLAEITPRSLNHFYFTSGGSESIETAVRIARLYWHEQGRDKYKIICLHGSYHGTSAAAATATSVGGKVFHHGFGPMVPGFIHIPSYYCYRCAFGLEYPSCGILCAKFLGETIEKEGPGSVAAFLAEPEQGTIGFVSPPPEYWPMVREICNKYEVLLIEDEVMAGFGRTGKMFAIEHWDVEPDIMTMAKGITSAYLPFGAVAFSDTFWDSLPAGSQLMHGFTYSGHPVCSAAAVATMDIYIKERIPQHASEVGEYTMERLNAEFKPLPHVGDIGGLGLMLGVELVADKATRATIPPHLPEQILQQARDNGLVIRIGRNNRVMIGPPLIITRGEMDQLLDILLPIVAGLKL